MITDDEKNDRIAALTDARQREEISALKARIAELENNHVPPGWVAVPIGLTTDIRNAFDDAMHKHLQCYLLSNDIEQVWSAMLAARGK